MNKKYANNLFIEGHFESEKYFENYKDEYTSNDSFITLEDKKKKNILDTNYFLKRIYNDHKANIIYKYISYSIKN